MDVKRPKLEKKSGESAPHDSSFAIKTEDEDGEYSNSDTSNALSDRPILAEELMNDGPEFSDGQRHTPSPCSCVTGVKREPGIPSPDSGEPDGDEATSLKPGGLGGVHGAARSLAVTTTGTIKLELLTTNTSGLCDADPSKMTINGAVEPTEEDQRPSCSRHSNKMMANMKKEPKSAETVCVTTENSKNGIEPNNSSAESISSGEKLVCELCDEVLPTLALWLKHWNAHEAPYVCNVCNKFFNKKAMLTHRQTHEKHRCMECKQLFPSAQSRRKHHAAAHVKPAEPKYVCNRCDIIPAPTFRNSMELRRHLTTHDSEKPFTCDLCDHKFSFSCRLRLREHKRALHTGECPFPCASCPARFSSRSSLVKHARIHDPTFLVSSIFTCTDCGWMLADRSSLTRHITKFHGNNLRSEEKT